MDFQRVSLMMSSSSPSRLGLHPANVVLNKQFWKYWGPLSCARYIFVNHFSVITVLFVLRSSLWWYLVFDPTKQVQSWILMPWFTSSHDCCRWWHSWPPTTPRGRLGCPSLSWPISGINNEKISERQTGIQIHLQLFDNTESNIGTDAGSAKVAQDLFQIYVYRLINKKVTFEWFCRIPIDTERQQAD